MAARFLENIADMTDGVRKRAAIVPCAEYRKRFRLIDESRVRRTGVAFDLGLPRQRMCQLGQRTALTEQIGCFGERDFCIVGPVLPARALAALKGFDGLSALGVTIFPIQDGDDRVWGGAFRGQRRLPPDQKATRAGPEPAANRTGRRPRKRHSSAT
jgi:hypothetical protein